MTPASPGPANPGPASPGPASPGPASRGPLSAARTLAHLELTIVRRLDGFLRGEHLGLLPGPGTELAEARLYRPGEDDVRHMDWAVTARTTQPHVRDVVADRELQTWAVVDLSGSMHFGTAVVDGAPQTKKDLAVAAVATVGVLTGRLGDRFGGYLLTGDRLRRYPARTGRAALEAMTRDLARATPAPATPDAPTLGQALHRVAAAHPRRGLRVVVSDFLGPAGPDGRPEWEPALRRLTRKHQVLCVETVDPREAVLPDVGVVELEDPETGAVVELDTGSARVREEFAARAAAHRRDVRSALRRAGAEHLVLHTDHDWVRDVARFVLRHRLTVHRYRRAAG